MDNKENQIIQTNAKEIYDSIIIPSELESLVKKTIESKDKESIDRQYKESQSTVSVIMKYIGAVAAVIILSVIVGLNSSETFAREMSEVPVLGSVAKVFTVRKYAVKENELVKEEETPDVEVVAETQVQEEIPVTVSGNSVEEQEETVVAMESVSDNSAQETVSGNEGNIDASVAVSGNDMIEQSVSSNDAE